MNGTEVTALPSGYGVYLFQTVLALAAVCLLAYVVLRFGLKRLYGVGRGSDSNLLRVVERLPLDPRRALYLVEVAGRYVLLGTSETGVTFLTEVESETVDEPPVDEPPASSLEPPTDDVRANEESES